MFCSGEKEILAAMLLHQYYMPECRKEITCVHLSQDIVYAIFLHKSEATRHPYEIARESSQPRFLQFLKDKLSVSERGPCRAPLLDAFTAASVPATANKPERRQRE